MWKKVKGQSLVEIIIVIGVIALLVTGLIAATTSSLQFSDKSKLRSQALQFAEEGLETIRNIRDDHWNILVSYAGGLYCIGKTGIFTSGACLEKIDTIFERTAEFTYTEETETMEVVVRVSWQEGDQVRTVTLSTELTNWRSL